MCAGLVPYHQNRQHWQAQRTFRIGGCLLCQRPEAKRERRAHPTSTIRAVALFLVTGLPGSGKSTICAALKGRGIVAYDADDDGLACWRDRQTGARTEPEDRACPPEFLRRNSRDIPRETIEALALREQGADIFVCGDPENEDELLDLFARAFALILDEETVKERLAARTNNTWGKLPHQVAYSLAFKETWDEWRRHSEYVELDASRPTEELVQSILAVASEQGRHG